MQTTPIQVIQVKFSIRFYQNINVTVKVLHQIASYGNFRAELQYSDSGKCQQEFRVVLHLHHQQPAISPANSALSHKSLSLYTMSQSSSASSSIYSITALSADNSVEDVGLFVQVDQSGHQIILPIILLPRKVPETYDFDGEDLIRIEEAILQQADSGNLRVPTQQEAWRLKQERVWWVQQVQLEPRSQWSLDTLERGEVIQLEGVGSTGGRRFQEELQDSERFQWTLAVWFGWFFGIIRNCGGKFVEIRK